MKVQFKKLRAGAQEPTRASNGAGCYDLFAPQGATILPNQRTVVGLGFAMELPDGYAADIRPRSGYSAKGFPDITGARHDADVALGTIDSDYRGEVGVIVSNHGGTFAIEPGQRIAQMLVHKAESVEWEACDALDDTERGAGGFGSTGK